MQNEDKIDWLSILTKIVDKPNKDNYLKVDNKIFNFKYVGFPTNRMGYLVLWEQTSKRAIHFSRLEVPEQYDFIDINSEEDIVKNIPNDLKYEGMNPSKNTSTETF